MFTEISEHYIKGNHTYCIHRKYKSATQRTFLKMLFFYFQWATLYTVVVKV